MAKKFSVKSKSNIFKSLGLLALILFTFYFIYNYLATGSFSLKPRASEIVVNDAGLTSCSQLLTDIDCNKYNLRGCSWVPGSQTKKLTTIACEQSDCEAHVVGCEIVSTTVNNPTTYTTFDCATGASISECRSGMYGCKVSYTDETKYRTVTKYTTTTTYTYSCSIGSTTSSGDCVRAGGSWIKTPHSVNTPYQVQEAYTVTHDNCSGTGTKSNPTTSTVTKTCSGFRSHEQLVVGVGSCTGTLKPLTPQLTPKSTPVVPGDPRVVNSTTTTPTPSSGTCSAGMTRCGIDRYGNENSMIEVCTSGNWTPKSSVGICGENKCEVSSGVAKCKTETTKVIGCKAGDTATVACTKPGYSKKGTCKSFAGIGIWRYSPCEKNSQRVKCETRIVSGGFQWRDPSLKDNKWSSIVKGEYCTNVFYDKKACVKGNENGYLICNYVAGAEDVCSNVGFFNTIDNNCQTSSDLADQYEPGLYGAKSMNDYSPQFQNIKCLRDVDCTNLTGISHLVCEGSNFSSFGRCVSNDMDGFCGNVKSQTSCDFYEGDVGVFKVSCIWNGKKCVARSYSRNNL